MPEGDTIHKIANYLAPRLSGQRVIELQLPDAAAAERCTGCCIRDIVARGKHLYIELDNHMAIRSHLGMYGSWHRYTGTERWHKPRRQASVVLSTGDAQYVCFNAKQVELVRTPSVRKRILTGRLGPDLIADDIEADYLVRRARDILEPDALLADALLDQRIASGIGNVYKSEILFLERHAPDKRIAALDDAALARCFETAAELLRRNLGGGRRVTRFAADNAGRLWVYGRHGQPCHRCRTPIVSKRLGRHHRGTYWCPSCQARDDR